jgi:hypothetical protein
MCFSLVNNRNSALPKSIYFYTKNKKQQQNVSRVFSGLIEPQCYSDIRIISSKNIKKPKQLYDPAIDVFVALELSNNSI